MKSLKKFIPPVKKPRLSGWLLTSELLLGRTVLLEGVVSSPEAWVSPLSIGLRQPVIIAQTIIRASVSAISFFIMILLFLMDTMALSPETEKLNR